MSEANKAVMQHIVDVFNGGDDANVEEYISAGMVDHQGVPGMDTNGPNGFRAVVKLFRGSFPDLYATTERAIAEGDLVVFYSRMTGTNTGEFMGMPATGKTIDIDGFDMIRIEDGKAVEHWGVFDTALMMQQLGLIPSS